jgi:nucleotidyltransferase/DNA polymerase involved in DNA repair
MATWRVAFLKAFGFHVAWERRLIPSLAGVPLAIIRNGRVFDLSPELTLKGINLGVRRNHLLEVCPEVRLIHYEPERYEEGWRRLLDICSRHMPVVEPLEVAEAFCDIAGLGENGAVIALCRRLGCEVWTELGMTVGLGLGPTKLVARTAGLRLGGKGLRAPGETWGVSEAQAFLDPLPVTYLYPFPPEIPAKLRRLGFHSIGEVRSIPVAELARQFGRPLAHRLAVAAGGGDREPVRPAWPPPSIQTILRFEGGLVDRGTFERALHETAKRFSREMTDQGLACGEIRMVLRNAGGRQAEASRRLVRPGRSPSGLGLVLTGLGEGLLEGWSEGDPPVEVEVRAGRVLSRAASQLDLLGLFNPGRDRRGDRREVGETVRELARRFGRGVVQAGEAGCEAGRGVGDPEASRRRRREGLLTFYDPLRAGRKTESVLGRRETEGHV